MPLPIGAEQAIVRKLARNVKNDARKAARWEFELEGLNLGSFGGGAGVKGVKFGSGKAKAKAVKAASRNARNARSLNTEPSGSDLRNVGCDGECGNSALHAQGVAHTIWEGIQMKQQMGGSAGSASFGGTVGLAPHSMNMQVIQPRFTSTFRDGVQVDILEGTDIVGPVNLSSTATTGDVLMEAYISPAAFHATRMAQLAVLYQRYRFVGIEFIYEPVANATETGQVIGFCTFDPDSPLQTHDSMNLNRAAAFFGNRQNQIWESASYGQHQPSSMTDLYVDPSGADTRFSYQGIFYLIAAGDMGLLGQIGNVYVRYKLELSIPQLQSGVGSIAASRYGFESEIASGVPELLGSAGISTIGSANTVTVTDLGSSTLRILGLQSGAIVAIAASAAWTGSGGSASQQGVSATPTSATQVYANGSAAVFNGAGGSWGFYGFYQVDSDATSMDLDLHTNGNLTGLTGSDTGSLVVVTFPPTVADLFKAKELKARQLSRIVELLKPLLRDPSPESGASGKGAAPVSSSCSTSAGPTAQKAECYALIKQALDSRNH